MTSSNNKVSTSFFPVVNISFSDYILTCFQKNTQANDFEDISEIIKAFNISTDDFAIRELVGFCYITFLQIST